MAVQGSEPDLDPRIISALHRIEIRTPGTAAEARRAALAELPRLLRELSELDAATSPPSG